MNTDQQPEGELYKENCLWNVVYTLYAMCRNFSYSIGIHVFPAKILNKALHNNHASYTYS